MHCSLESLPCYAAKTDNPFFFSMSSVKDLKKSNLNIMLALIAGHLHPQLLTTFIQEFIK